MKQFGKYIEVNGNVEYRVAKYSNGDIAVSLSAGAGGRAKLPAKFTFGAHPIFDAAARLSGGVRMRCDSDELVDLKLEFGASVSFGLRWEWKNWFSGNKHFIEGMYGGSWKFDLIKWKESQPWEYGGGMLAM